MFAYYSRVLPCNAESVPRSGGPAVRFAFSEKAYELKRNERYAKPRCQIY
jgi:hypothetical protein